LRIQRHTARVRNIVRSPADALLFARMLGWAAALPVLKRRMPLPKLVETAAPEARVVANRRPETVIAFSRWVYRIPGLRDNCLEKSLLTYRYLPADGGRYRLVLGVRASEAEGPPGHAWLTIDGVPVHDTDQSLADLVPIIAFDSAGRREEVESGGRTAARAGDGEQRGEQPEEQREGSPDAG
jgi:hypothetical protein